MTHPRRRGNPPLGRVNRGLADLVVRQPPYEPVPGAGPADTRDVAGVAVTITRVDGPDSGPWEFGFTCGRYAYALRIFHPDFRPVNDPEVGMSVTRRLIGVTHAC